MTCHIQSRAPIQLDLSLPSNGCTSDAKVYYHHDGSVFSCDWDEKKKTHECASSYPGVTWQTADNNHIVITLSETSNMDERHFRYQFSCHNNLESSRCSTPAVFPVPASPFDSTTERGNISEVTSTIFNSTTIHNIHEDSEQSVNKELIVSVVVSGFLILILVLIITLLFRKNLRLKRSIKKERQETASKNAGVTTTSILLEAVKGGTTDVDIEDFADSGCVSNTMSTDHTTPRLSRNDSECFELDDLMT